MRARERMQAVVVVAVGERGDVIEASVACPHNSDNDTSVATMPAASPDIDTAHLRASMRTCKVRTPGATKKPPLARDTKRIGAAVNPAQALHNHRWIVAWITRSTGRSYEALSVCMLRGKKREPPAQFREREGSAPADGLQACRLHQRVFGSRPEDTVGMRPGECRTPQALRATTLSAGARACRRRTGTLCMAGRTLTASRCGPSWGAGNRAPSGRPSCATRRTRRSASWRTRNAGGRSA